jgi:hypothetical protein
MVSPLLRHLLHGKQSKGHDRAFGKARLLVEFLETRALLTTLAPGSVILLQAGDGSAYSGTAPLFLVEYDLGTGKVVQSIAIPNNQPAGGPGNQPITMDLGAAAGNGQLNRSYDGSVLTFGGLDSGINSVTANGSADRVIAVC